MTNFWPEGIDLNDTQSPRDILNAARNDWQVGTDGLMDLVLQDAQSESGNLMIIVHAKHLVSNRTATLFSIVHRPNYPYPVKIQLKDEKIPSSLQKSYYVPNHRKLLSVAAELGLKESESSGRMIQNHWVSETPTEFRHKLIEAFNSGVVKSEILNLASVAMGDMGDSVEDSIEDLADESNSRNHQEHMQGSTAQAD